MIESILLVDDDKNILSALSRQLHRKFDISTACGGPEGLERLKSDGPFAVVVSDMQMPNMDGVAFLSAVKKVSPHTVRIMLTGNADQATAITAVNQGSIFRFHTKPCPVEDLVKALDDGLEQYRLVTAERDLLEKTLAGSVKVFVDVLTLLDPESFRVAQQQRDWVVKLAKRLEVRNPWQLSVGAMLSALGAISIPASIRAKARNDYRLTLEEQTLIDQAPGVARSLLANIPRMEVVSDIVYYQNKGYDGSGYPKDDVKGDDLPLGARLLKILNDLVSASGGKTPCTSAFKTLANQLHLYDEKLFAVVMEFFESDKSDVDVIDTARVTSVAIGALSPGVRIASDIVTKSGKLILAAGQVLTPAQAMIVSNLVSIQELSGEVKVIRPRPKRKT